MAGVQVFVDDFVLGDLPMVCAKTGAPADGKAPASTSVGGVPGWAFLLIFLGPLGWIALALVAFTGPGSETVAGWIPMTEEAFERIIRARRMLRTAVGLAVLGLVLVLMGGSSLGLWSIPPLVLTVGAALATVAAAVASDRSRVSITLDGSRRWVTLGRVHPAFEAAVEADQRDPRARQP